MRCLARAAIPFAALSALLLAACTDRPTHDTPLGPNALPPQVVAAVDEENLTLPLSGLTAAELNRFNQGRAVFERVFESSNGLGPLFNSTSCAGCHEDPSVGGFGDDLTEDVETHVSVATGSSCDDLSAFGGVRHYVRTCAGEGNRRSRAPDHARSFRIRTPRGDSRIDDPRARRSE